MGVKRQLQKEGNGVDRPQQGDTVIIHYHGTLESTGAKLDQMNQSCHLWSLS